MRCKSKKPCTRQQKTESTIARMKRRFKKTEWWIRRVCPICGADLTRYALVGHHVLPRRPFSRLSDAEENIFVGCAHPDCGHSLDRPRASLGRRIVRIARLLGLKKAVWARRQCRQAKVWVRPLGSDT